MIFGFFLLSISKILSLNFLFSPPPLSLSLSLSHTLSLSLSFFLSYSIIIFLYSFLLAPLLDCFLSYLFDFIINSFYVHSYCSILFFLSSHFFSLSFYLFVLLPFVTFFHFFISLPSYFHSFFHFPFSVFRLLLILFFFSHRFILIFFSFPISFCFLSCFNPPSLFVFQHFFSFFFLKILLNYITLLFFSFLPSFIPSSFSSHSPSSPSFSSFLSFFHSFIYSIPFLNEYLIFLLFVLLSSHSFLFAPLSFFSSSLINFVCLLCSSFIFLPFSISLLFFFDYFFLSFFLFSHLKPREEKNDYLFDDLIASFPHQSDMKRSQIILRSTEITLAVVAGIHESRQHRPPNFPASNNSDYGRKRAEFQINQSMCLYFYTFSK
ncbi:unnamed protein product [Acanthosepion pharaonis]|uniref:Uncharacterized protein n=1 Tax=Acanthosepion pharaonis TaxID=158019 RepID=A0A812E8T7_ACAPH|nr:unnamed protein product [Sepia pharaonis]